MRTKNQRTLICSKNVSLEAPPYKTCLGSSRLNTKGMPATAIVVKVSRWKETQQNKPISRKSLLNPNTFQTTASLSFMMQVTDKHRQSI